MGKFTDDYFIFPIKIYDGFSLKKALKEEEAEYSNGPVPIDWVTGWVRIPARDLDKLVWHDGFSRDRTVEDVHNNGFDTTIVISDIYGEFVSTWPRKKFEQKIDEFIEKWKSSLPPVNMPWFTTSGILTDGVVITSTSTHNATDSPEGTEKKPD